MTIPTFIPSLHPILPSPSRHDSLRRRLHLHHSFPRRPSSHLPFQPLRCTAQPPTTSPSPPQTSPSPPRRIGLVTVLLFLAALIWSIIISFIMILTSPFRRNTSWHASLTLLWMRDVFRSAFIRVVLHGRENLPTTAALIVANSQSMLDMFALAFLKLDIRFVVPARAMRLPILGAMFARAGWIGAKEGRKGQMKALDDCVEALRGGSSVALFPEGALSGMGKMRKFGSPAFKVAKKAEVPVVPVTVSGTGGMMEGGSMPWKFPKGAIEVTVHPPFQTEEKSEKELANMAHEAVKGALPQEFRGD